jgi:hypothetical protein
MSANPEKAIFISSKKDFLSITDSFEETSREH